MIDYFALALTHGLLLVAVLRLLGRRALDHELPEAAPDADSSQSAPSMRQRRRDA